MKGPLPLWKGAWEKEEILNKYALSISHGAESCREEVLKRPSRTWQCNGGSKCDNLRSS